MTEGVVLLDYVALFFIGLLATTVGTLAGGGGLISLPAMLLLGIPIHSAIGANKVSNTVSSFSSFYILLKHKKISMRESVWVIPISLLGGVTGGFIATKLSAENLYMVAIILLSFAFVSSFFGKGSFSGEQSLTLNKVSVPGLYSVGIYDGVFGPGQGTLLFYLFNYLDVAYIRAVGYVRLATFSSCFGAAITYIAAGTIVWPLTIVLMAGSISGAQLGVRFAEKLNPKYVKPLLRIVTILLILQIIFDKSQ